MIYLVLAVLILHIVSAPIPFGADFSLSNEKRTVSLCAHIFAIPVIFKRIDFDTIERALLKNDKNTEIAEETRRSKNEGKKLISKKRLIETGKELILRINVRNMTLSGTVGLSDAAACAVACSAANIFYSQACAYFRTPCSSGLSANNSGVTEIFAGGIFSITIADIIIVLFRSCIRSLYEKPSRRVQRAPD